MWWMTTTPPRVDGASGRATYASTSSPPAPVILLVPARMASSISVLPVVVAALIGPHLSATGRPGAELKIGAQRPTQATEGPVQAPSPHYLWRNRGQARSGRAAAGGGRRRAREGDGRRPRQ